MYNNISFVRGVMNMAKTCPKCGASLEDDAKFCSKCGAAYSAELFCSKCGQKLAPDDRFCPNCGAEQSAAVENEGATLVKTGEKYIKKGFDTFATTINTMAGEQGKVEIHLKELFSGITKSHSQEERDELFVCGTSKTTPKESEMIDEWPSPWLYSRVFLMFGIVFAGLYFMAMKLQNTNVVPGAMFIGALLVPLTVIIFFWEMNVPRNISIIDVISMFFVGGVFSLVVTLLLFEIFPAGELNYAGAIVVGLVEEIGKALVVAYYIKKRNPRYKLNGLLLGACVGAGFAVFETTGYAFNSFFSTAVRAIQHNVAPWGPGLEATMDTLFLRGVLAIGGHVVWAAISGVGLIVAKGEEPLKTDHLLSAKFLKFLFLVVALHAVWDMPLLTGSIKQVYLKDGALTAIALATVLVLLSSGLRQVSAIVKEAKAREAAGIAEEPTIPAPATQPEETKI